MSDICGHCGFTQCDECQMYRHAQVPIEIHYRHECTPKMREKYQKIYSQKLSSKIADPKLSKWAAEEFKRAFKESTNA